MKNNKVIILITIIAVIAIVGVFFGVNYLMDAYVQGQRATQSGNQAVTGQAVSPAYSLIMVTMDSPEESGICGEHLEWYFKDEVLVITGTGKMDEYIYSANSAPWHSLWDQIGCVIVDEGITSIGGAAFMGCRGMTEIVLPSSLTYIYDRAFFGCSSLMQINLPESVTSIGKSVFYGCSSLREITLPDNITSIGESAFENCSDLTKITLSSSLTNISKNAFYVCSSLREITLPDRITIIDES
ncbi:MAG: leucine-rich repeat domain-containing protein [Lachnospiraceae bacterium]|nr:leucine-rich repeat domain-containing protein [Lachnospiraceae bacterium]